MIGDVKLIAEMLDVIAAIDDPDHYHSYIKDTTFFSSLMAISHRHGWDILKSPLLAMFANYSSHNVEKYFTFLTKIAASEIVGHEKDCVLIF